MYSNNDSNHSFTLITSGIFMLIILIVLSSIIVKTNNKVISLSNDIAGYKSIIESANKQIASYKLENDELKAKIFTYTEERQELAQRSIEEDVDADLELLAQLIESESGTQSFEGKLAVGTVVMNRVESDEFPDTIRDVIFQKGQFSVVPNGTIHNEPSDDSLKAAKEIMLGSRVLDPDVLYFYNPKLTSKTNWVRKLKVTKRIEDHVFAV